MTTKCNVCGSSQVRIDVEDVYCMDADTTTKRSQFEVGIVCPDMTFSNPRCAMCNTPRTDIGADDMDEIWSWA